MDGFTSLCNTWDFEYEMEISNLQSVPENTWDFEYEMKIWNLQSVSENGVILVLY